MIYLPLEVRVQNSKIFDCLTCLPSEAWLQLGWALYITMIIFSSSSCDTFSILDSHTIEVLNTIADDLKQPVPSICQYVPLELVERIRSDFHGKPFASSSLLHPDPFRRSEGHHLVSECVKHPYRNSVFPYPLFLNSLWQYIEHGITRPSCVNRIAISLTYTITHPAAAAHPNARRGRARAGSRASRRSSRRRCPRPPG